MEYLAVEPKVHGSLALASRPNRRQPGEKPRSLKAALYDSEALSRSILDASADCIKIVSCDGTIELMNAPGLCAMEVDSLDHVVGREW
jgi:hypothetical protein